MYRTRSHAIAGLLICLLFGSAAWLKAAPPDLPDGKGKAQFTRICSQCHGVEIVIRKGNTADGWSAVVDDMVSRGAQGTDDDFDLIVQYLAEHFGPKVNINKADEKELSAALGLSETDAQAIVKYRQASGNFKEWSDLQKVPNIDMKKLEGQKDRIDFSSN